MYVSRPGRRAHKARSIAAVTPTSLKLAAVTQRKRSVKPKPPKASSRARPPTRAERRAETLEQILDTAEDLFSKHGLYGVTLKDVAKVVGVHHTLMNYYFKDKKKLFDEVFARRAIVSSTRRMNALDAYDAVCQGKPTVEGALRAFLDTDLDLYIHGGKRWKNYGALGAQVANTPKWGAKLMDKHFDPVVTRLISLLQRALPAVYERGRLLGLSLRDRCLAPYAGAYGTNRQVVRRRVQVGGLRSGEEAHGDVHGRRVHGGLLNAAEGAVRRGGRQGNGQADLAPQDSLLRRR